MARLLSLLVCLLFPTVTLAAMSDAPPQPQFVCEGPHTRVAPKPPEAVRIGDEVTTAISDIHAAYRAEHTDVSFFDLRVESDIAVCLHEQVLATFEYPKVRSGYLVYSTAPQTCQRARGGCSLGAIVNIGIEIVISTELLKQNREHMVRWIAAKAICYVQISQNFTDGISDVTEITAARIEYCVSDLVGVAEHLNYYITIQGGYTNEAGVYLAWLQEKYAHPW